MKELLAFLNSIYPLENSTVEFLRENIQVIEIPKKKFLLKQGHICFNIYFITKGLVRCFYDKDDKEINAWFMKEGDVIISVESFFSQTISRESIQAIEDCILYFISYNDLQKAYEKYPEFNFVGRILTEKYYQLSEQRLYSLRMQRAAEKYDFLMNHFPQIILRVPSKYISSYLGIAEETLSRIRAQKN